MDYATTGIMYDYSIVFFYEYFNFNMFWTQDFILL